MTSAPETIVEAIDVSLAITLALGLVWRRRGAGATAGIGLGLIGGALIMLGILMIWQAAPAQSPRSAPPPSTGSQTGTRVARAGSPSSLPGTGQTDNPAASPGSPPSAGQAGPQGNSAAGSYASPADTATKLDELKVALNAIATALRDLKPTVSAPPPPVGGAPPPPAPQLILASATVAPLPVAKPGVRRSSQSSLPFM